MIPNNELVSRRRNESVLTRTLAVLACCRRRQETPSNSFPVMSASIQRRWIFAGFQPVADSSGNDQQLLDNEPSKLTSANRSWSRSQLQGWLVGARLSRNIRLIWSSFTRSKSEFPRVPLAFCVPTNMLCVCSVFWEDAELNTSLNLSAGKQTAAQTSKVYVFKGWKLVNNGGSDWEDLLVQTSDACVIVCVHLPRLGSVIPEPSEAARSTRNACCCCSDEIPSAASGLASCQSESPPPPPLRC